MMTMHFREGAEVLSQDGTKIGTVEHLVVDPSQDAITHIVVSKGFLFPKERVLPIDSVAEASHETVVVGNEVDPDQLPEFEESHYIYLDDAAAGAEPTPDPAPLVWALPIYGAEMTGYPVYPPGTIRETTRNVPDGSHVVKAGSSVVTADGEDVGKVREVDVSDSGGLISIAVDPGWFKKEQTIPAQFIRTIDDDRVVLAVGSKTLSQLERRGATTGG
jgi:uncharacterized protein YrrD